MKRIRPAAAPAAAMEIIDLEASATSCGARRGTPCRRAWQPESQLRRSAASAASPAAEAKEHVAARSDAVEHAEVDQQFRDESGA